MTARPGLVTDSQIERMLHARSATLDDSLLAAVLSQVETAPQDRPWLRRVSAPMSRRTLVLVALVVLLAAMVGAAIVASFGRPTPPLPMSRYHHNGSILVMNGGLPMQVVDIRGEEPATRVELPPMGNVGHISWSPDGRSFAYARPGAVSIADLGTGSARQIAGCIGAPRLCIPAWSPDGAELAVSRVGKIDLITPGGALVASLPLNVGPIAALAWAPDGGRLAFATDGSSVLETSTLYVVDRDGSRLQALPDAAAPKTAILDLAWAPNGSQIVYINTSAWSNASGWGPMTLFGIAPDGTHRTAISEAGACFCLGLLPGGVAWSPDGTKIALGKPGDGLFVITNDRINLGKVADYWVNPAWRPVP